MAWSNLAVEILGEFGSYAGESLAAQVGELRTRISKTGWAHERRKEARSLFGTSSSPEELERRRIKDRARRERKALQEGRPVGRIGRLANHPELWPLSPEERRRARQDKVNANHAAWRERQKAKPANFGLAAGVEEGLAVAVAVLSAAEREGRVVRRRSAGAERHAAGDGDRVDGAAQVGREAHAGEAPR